jgi:hypothetical protein
MGKNCIQGDSLFVDPYLGNFRLNNNSKAKQSIYNNSFRFNLDIQQRAAETNNLGCY